MKIISSFDHVIEVPAEGACVAKGDRERIRSATADRIESVLITRRLIQRRIQAMAEAISARFRGPERLELVFILEGARPFATALEQAIYESGGPETRCQAVKAGTYGAEIKSEGETSRRVRISLPPTGLEGRRVVLIDDILDQGFTLQAVRRWLLDEVRAAEVGLGVLLEKELRSPTPQVKKLRERLKPDWTGFRIPDRWVAGYGIDAGEDFRALPFLVVVREEYYLRKA